MIFAIHSYVGAGKILLGMSSQQIEDVLSRKPEKFKKFEDDDFDTDVFEWCHIYYKNPGVCEAVEFFKPATVIFMGQDLIGKPFKDVEKIFLENDNAIEFDESGLISYKYGIGIYAPFAKKVPLEKVEGVIVFEKGYYE